MDPELAVDIQNGLGDNSTDIELELGNDGAMIASSFEEVSCLGQNDEMIHESSRGGGTVVEGDEPYVGQEFESEEAAHAFYSAYSMRFGFITRINYLSRSKLDGSVIGRTIVCNKEGYRKAYRCDINKKNIKPRTPTRVGCKAMLSVRKLSTGKWVVTKFVKEHTHALTAVNSQNCSIINQIPNENMKIQELTQQLLLERERSASLRKTIDLLFNHIEEHTQDLSKTVQYIADKWSLYSLTNSPKTNEIRLMEVQYVVKQCCHSRHKHVLSRFSKKKKKKKACAQPSRILMIKYQKRPMNLFEKASALRVAEEAKGEEEDDEDEFFGDEGRKLVALASLSSSFIVSSIFLALYLMTLIYCGGATSVTNFAIREFAIKELS